MCQFGENYKYVDVIVFNIPDFHHFFIFFYISQGSVVHSSGVVGKIRNISLQIPRLLQWWKTFNNGEKILKVDRHLANLLTKNVVFFMTHSVD